MQDLKVFITEKLDVSRDYAPIYNYHPTTKIDLKNIIMDLVEERGNNGDFNDIDTSKIKDMSSLFDLLPKFNGDVSRWNTSRVEYMDGMFEFCDVFNCDISKWDVRKVETMSMMFHGAKKIQSTNW